jgi:hypothetical protein
MKVMMSGTGVDKIVPIENNHHHNPYKLSPEHLFLKAETQVTLRCQKYWT